MFIPISLLSEFIFVEPYLVLHVTEYSAFGFTLVIVVSIISAIVIPMNVYRIKRLQKGTSKIGGSMIGAMIGASAGICGCGPIGFSIISIFGTVAGTTTAFLTEYEIPIRLHMEVTPSITLRVEAEGGVLEDRQADATEAEQNLGDDIGVEELNGEPDTVNVVSEDVAEDDTENTSEATNNS